MAPGFAVPIIIFVIYIILDRLLERVVKAKLYTPNIAFLLGFLIPAIFYVVFLIVNYQFYSPSDMGHITDSSSSLDILTFALVSAVGLIKGIKYRHMVIKTAD